VVKNNHDSGMKQKKGNSGSQVSNRRVSPVMQIIRHAVPRGFTSRGLPLAGERQERNIPAPLHRHGHFALMPRAIAGDAAGKDLAPFGNEESEGLHVLVIDERGLVNTEPAHLLPDLKTSFVRASAVSSAAA
jgi:hypothetical protein